jgi:hypothetical protein
MLLWFLLFPYVKEEIKALLFSYAACFELWLSFLHDAYKAPICNMWEDLVSRDSNPSSALDATYWHTYQLFNHTSHSPSKTIYAVNIFDIAPTSTTDICAYLCSKTV